MLITADYIIACFSRAITTAMGARESTKIGYTVEVAVRALPLPGGGNNAFADDCITCDMEVRVHAHRGALPTILMYSLRSAQLYKHHIDWEDLGSVEYVEIAVRRGAPAARGRVSGNYRPFAMHTMRVVERYPGHERTNVFRRQTPLQLGESLGISVLLEPVSRTVRSLVGDAGDIAVCESGYPQEAPPVALAPAGPLSCVAETTEDSDSDDGYDADADATALVIGLSVSEEAV